jgi:hypothetical protein
MRGHTRCLCDERRCLETRCLETENLKRSAWGQKVTLVLCLVCWGGRNEATGDGSSCWGEPGRAGGGVDLGGWTRRNETLRSRANGWVGGLVWKFLGDAEGGGDIGGLGGKAEA